MRIIWLTNLADVGSATVQSLAYTLADTNFPTQVADGVTSTNTVYAMGVPDSQYRLNAYTVMGGAAGSNVVYDANSNRMLENRDRHDHHAERLYQPVQNPRARRRHDHATTNANGNVTVFCGYGAAAAMV